MIHTSSPLEELTFARRAEAMLQLRTEEQKYERLALTRRVEEVTNLAPEGDALSAVLDMVNDTGTVHGSLLQTYEAQERRMAEMESMVSEVKQTNAEIIARLTRLLEQEEARQQEHYRVRESYAPETLQGEASAALAAAELHHATLKTQLHNHSNQISEKKQLILAQMLVAEGVA